MELQIPRIGVQEYKSGTTDWIGLLRCHRREKKKMLGLEGLALQAELCWHFFWGGLLARKILGVYWEDIRCQKGVKCQMSFLISTCHFGSL